VRYWKIHSEIFSISSLVKISITWLFPICFRAWNFTIFCLGLYKQNITRWLEDTTFIFSYALVRKILFSPLEDKSHIFAPPCNILYILLQRFRCTQVHILIILTLIIYGLINITRLMKIINIHGISTNQNIILCHCYANLYLLRDYK
jgi:hypothetical protein